MLANRSTRVWRALGALALLGSTLGCAAEQGETQKRLRSLELKLADLRDENQQLLERLSALELQEESRLRKSQDEPIEAPQRPLPIIRLQPGGPLDAPATSGAAESLETASSLPAPPTTPSDDERPVIRIEGDQILEPGTGPGARGR